VACCGIFFVRRNYASHIGQSWCCDSDLLLYYALCLTQPQQHPQFFRIAQEIQFQHADCTSKVHKQCPTVLYASSFFSHPHWSNITACCLHSTPSSSNVTAGGSQYVICAKYEIHKTINQQLQPRGYSRGTTHAIC